MSRIILTRAQRQTLRTNANGTAKLINGPLAFLKECIRWGLPLRIVLPLLRITTLAGGKQLHTASLGQIGTQLDIADVPLWVEIDQAHLASDIPSAWGAPEVVTDPGDPLADPPVLPTTRPRQWSEVRMYMVRDSRHFAPASNGVRYFRIGKVTNLEGQLGILGFVDSADIPAAPAP